MEDKHKNSPYWNLPRVLGAAGGTVLILAVGWKVITASFVVDLTSFSFSDFLSMILALFSIWLSLIFYLKANETSNSFYHNTFTFTKETSEILGRIEAGFSERLRRIDETQVRIGDRMDKMPLSFTEATRQIEEGRKTAGEAEENRDNLLRELTEKAGLQDAQRDEFLRRIREQDNQIAEAKQQIYELRAGMAREEAIPTREATYINSTSRMAHRLLSQFLMAHPGLPQEQLRDSFSRWWQTLDDRKQIILRESGMVNHDDALSLRGGRLLLSMQPEVRDGVIREAVGRA
jgi:hypothetical protein